MSFSSALAAVRAKPNDLDALEDLAAQALEAGEEQQALEWLGRVVQNAGIARLWQWKGLLERSLDEHELALVSFAQAARLDPRDASIARGHARVALEAGVPAETLYEQARRLAPADGSLLVGLAAARLAAGHGDQAEAELAAALARSPKWIEGHQQLAQLRSMLGRPSDAPKSIERAVAQEPQLWPTLFDLHVKAKRYDLLEDAIERSRSQSVAAALVNAYEAIAAVELGQTERADQLLAALDASAGPALPVWRVRHLLRCGRFSEAVALIDRELAGSGARDIWPYASATWRLAKDPRSEWLESDPTLVSLIDLTPDLPPIEDLSSVLRALHVAKGEYLDQSVRGGTQTDGPLFSRVDPVIRQVRSAVVRAVERHLQQLPPIDERHPTLRYPRDRRIRFSGSWSVRLAPGGSHENHVHPLGWISSALYISLPERTNGEPDHSGWLALGEPDATLALRLPPMRRVEPVVGRLALFPSWMWHGTIPFEKGERLTIAFDVAPPR